MGKKESAEITFFRRKDIFCDAFNHLVFGSDLLDPNMLSEADTRSVLRDNVDQRQRDILKYAEYISEGRRYRIISGIELQNKVCYYMPVRVMEYDCRNLLRQIEDIQSKNAEKAKSQENGSANESDNLYHFLKTDKILPVTTLVVYFGKDKWDAPNDLWGMYDLPPNANPAIPNYPIHVLDIGHLERDQIDLLSSELKLVSAVARRVIGKADDSIEYTYGMPGLDNMSLEASRLIQDFTGIKTVLRRGKKGGIDMKKKLLSMEEWKKNCTAQGKQEGLQQGKEVLDQISQMIQNGSSLADVQVYVNESKRQLEDLQEAASG